MNHRRCFLIAVGNVLTVSRLASTQHAERIYRICWLTPAPGGESYNIAFEQRLRELGFAEGRNLVIEFRTAEGRLERLAELAADLARQNCDTLLASGSEATSTCPRAISRRGRRRP